MFRDRIRLKLKAGDGGNGKVAFGFNHVPMGGTGGNGGNVYLEGVSNMYDFGSLKPDYEYKAANGVPGGEKNLTGANGEDLVLRVPIRTVVYNSEKDVVITIDEVGEKKLLLEGGLGGLGNWYYRRGGARNAERFTEGKPGARLDVALELELQSDIIFIGLPNAGKSSILNEFTNADSEVAAYPFTTLIPQLGRMDGVVLMDLPGLIENTAQGKGLGTHFVKHTRSAKVVAHFVSLESADPVADYELIRNEMLAISPNLAEKHEIIVLTKADLIKTADIPAKIRMFKQFGKEVVAVSIHDADALADLKHRFAGMVAAANLKDGSVLAS